MEGVPVFADPCAERAEVVRVIALTLSNTTRDQAARKMLIAIGHRLIDTIEPAEKPKSIADNIARLSK